MSKHTNKNAVFACELPNNDDLMLFLQKRVTLTNSEYAVYSVTSKRTTMRGIYRLKSTVCTADLHIYSMG